MTALALLLPAAPDASASSIAQLATRLAADTERLGGARSDLEDVRTELQSIRGEHRRLRRQVEGRLVAIYKHGNSTGALTRVAGGESVRDVSVTLDALDQVADHDEALLRRWQQLDRRRRRLVRERRALEREVESLERRVEVARRRLSTAQARADQVRREAVEMARIEESPLLPKVGNPENTSVEAVEGRAAPAQPIGFEQTGTASFYDDSFAGEKTANGEVYDPNAFTAAHPSLPFGTWVTVRGPGGAVSVRINDRGPYVGGRIIDLSRAAAQAIGLSLGEVTISVAA